VTRDGSRRDRLSAGWRSAERAALGLSMIVMSLLIVGNIASRQLFNTSWAFTEEIGGLLLIVITFGGLSYAAEQRRHINMSAVYDLLSPRGQQALTRAIDLVTALVMLAMAYIALRYVIQIAHSGDSTNVLRIPMFIPLIIVPLGFLLTAIRYASSLLASGTRRRDDPSLNPVDTSSAAQ